MREHSCMLANRRVEVQHVRLRTTLFIAGQWTSRARQLITVDRQAFASFERLHTASLHYEHDNMYAHRSGQEYTANEYSLAQLSQSRRSTV